MENYQMLQEELDLIKNEKLKEFTILCLKEAPEYFYHVPASSSGKLHPYNDLGEGGLIRHTKAVVQVAMDLIRCEQFLINNSDEEHDHIIIACILHDVIKNGFIDCGKTVPEHPLLAAEFIEGVYDKYKDSNELYSIWMNKNAIAHLITTHMGIWNKDKEGNEVLPLLGDFNLRGKLVHLADYIASRKYVDITLLKSDIRN